MRLIRLIAPALAALTVAASPALADQVLGQGRIDSANRVILPGGPTLGTWQGQKYTATPDSLAVKSVGSVIPWARKEAGAVTRNLIDKLYEHLSVKDFGAVGDTTSVDSVMKADDGPAIQRAIDACNGCIIDVPSGIYKIATPLTGKGGIRWMGQSSVGSNFHAAPSGGSILSNAQSTAAMYTVPGSSNLTSTDASSWSFEAITLQGNNRPVPIVSAPETKPGRGSWSARFYNVLFDGGRPAIYAANAWDWWAEGSSFTRCGDVTKADNAVGLDLTDSCILIFDSAQTYAGANSNSWRIKYNFFDITKGRAIVSDSSGAGGPNQFMLITGNHFGPTGNESLYGCFSQSTISDNMSEGSFPGRPGMNLFVPGNRGGCGQNRILGNLLTAAGTFHIVDGLAGDLIANNTMQPEGTGGAFVQLTPSALRATVINNKVINATNDNSVPTVLDQGLGSTIRGNSGSDNRVANNEEPLRLDGTSLYGQLSPQSGLTSYTPTITCGSGSFGALGSVVGRYKQVAKLVFVSVTIPITAVGNCGTNVQFNLPITPAGNAALGGRETVGNQLSAAAALTGVATVYVTKFDGTFQGFNGANLVVSGWYQGQ